MRIEWWILIIVNAMATGILIFTAVKQIRLAAVAFLFKQVITFLFGLLVVEFDMIEYPVRLFSAINRTSFTYEYYAFPAVCALFNVWYPSDRSVLVQLGYYVGYTSVLTAGEVLIEKYTALIDYIHWEWYISWITIFLSFFLVRIFCVWFFHSGENSSSSRNFL
ncbi:CBO0543 family protein [Fredinandcohnia quinoae]|uniref:Uncharacterized protein n=1 Tax=Fredinandcohnia quinoae TaxID=2918902 RepID=A0AAW5DZE6_9BACI|nr:CBO0543 family protein [Fredinandcohnia sp. SECRCQ15]MCH1624395.1 hypothetical protein [Fredinandcohnia sp. SECRCQ15]